MRLFLFCTMVAFSSMRAGWSSDPSVNTVVSSGAEDSEAPLIINGTEGDFYISWVQAGSEGLDMMLQRLDLMGDPVWQTGGVTVRENISSGMISLYDLNVDPSGAALLAFTVENGERQDQYVYRISPSGESVWGSQGILLSDTTSGISAAFPSVISTSGGDILVSWSMMDAPDTAWTVVQRLSPQGDPQWGQGVTFGADSTGLYCWEASLCPTLNAAVILVYTISNSEAWNKRLYAMRIDLNGNQDWSSPAVISDSRNVLQQCVQPTPNADGAGGLFITWSEYTEAGTITSLVQRVTGEGSLSLPAGGAEVSTLETMLHTEPSLAITEDNLNAYVFWEEMDSLQSQYGISGQLLDAQGNRQWGDTGAVFHALGDTAYTDLSCQSFGDSAIVFFRKDMGQGEDRLLCMAVDPTGDYLWSGEWVGVSTASSSRSQPSSTPLNWEQQWVVVWSDQGGSAGTIQAQNVKLDGTLGQGGLGISEDPSSPGDLISLRLQNPTTGIVQGSFFLGAPSFAHVGIFDLSGRLIALITDGFFPAGSHTISFEPQDIGAGIYMVRADALGECAAVKVVVLN